MTETESEWDEEERAWPLALAEIEAGECPGCGHPLEDTLYDPEKPPKQWQASYEACSVCAELESAQATQSARDEDTKQRKNPYDYPQARRWMVKEVKTTQ